MEPTTAIETLALLGVYAVLFFSTVQAVILGYHWYSYGSSKSTSNTAMIVFLSGAATLVAGLFLSYLNF